MLRGVSRMDITDIVGQFLDILLSGKRRYGSLSVTLSNLQRERFSTQRLISVGLRIKIGIFDSRNFEGSLMTGHSQEVVNNTAFQAIDR